jgi:hypothetical protein
MIGILASCMNRSSWVRIGISRSIEGRRRGHKVIGLLRRSLRWLL